MLFINELKFIFRQPLTLLSFVFLPVFSYVLSVGLQIDEGTVSYHFQLTQMSLIMLTLPVVIAIFSVLIMQRDVNAHMHELVNATPLTDKQRKLVRFSAVIGVVSVIFILCFIVTIIAYSSTYSFQNEFILYSMANTIILLLPSLLLGVALAQLLSAYFQSNIVIYVGFSFIWLGYLFIASITGSPILAGSNIINDSIYNFTLWLDPYGITYLIEQLKSPERYMSPQLLFNRFIYLLISVALIFCALHIKPRLQKTKQASKIGKIKAFQQPHSPFTNLIYTQFATLLRSRITQLIFTLWIFLIFNEILSGISYAEPMSIIQPTSIDALNRIAFDLLPVAACFLLILWSWQICQHDKHYNMAELTAAIAINNSKRVFSHIVTIWLITIFFLVLTAISAIIAEWFAGSNWSLLHYCKQLSLNCLPLLLLGSIFVSIHHIFSSTLKIAGMQLFIILVKLTSITTTFGITHTLWNLADSPLQQPDHYWGYQGSLSLYFPYLTIGVLMSISLVCLAICRSHRGTGYECIPVKRMPKKCFIPVVITILAGLAFHSMLITEKQLYNSDKREAWKANYEKTFNHWQAKAQPSISHIDAQVDIYPDQQFARFKLNYILENRTNQAISKILIGGYGNQNKAKINFEEAIRLSFDSELNHSVYQLKKVLLPGESRQLQASFTFKQPKLWPARMHQIVKPSFTYLRSVGLLPTIGYQQHFQLNRAQIRKRYGLNPLSQLEPSANFNNNNQHNETYNWLSLNSIVSTQSGHHAISQGKLLKHWQDDNREYYHYQTSSPIRAIPAWLSTPNSALTQYEQDIQLNVHARTINQSAKINMQAMANTINWLSEHISPYRAKQLHLIAIPDIGATGYALPQIILISDKLGFRAMPAKDAGFDQRYRRAVHETAHQWFGHDLGNGVTQERSFLIESMAKYIELVLIEKHFGEATMQALVDYEQTRFTQAERNSLHAPTALIDATQTHHMYSRATLVFAKLRESVGDRVITQSLRALWQQHAYPKSPATSVDFINLLKQFTEQKNHRLIESLFLSNEFEY